MRYSCENIKLKQKWLLTLPHPAELLLANVSDVAAGVGVPVTGSDEAKVPNIDMFVVVHASGREHDSGVELLRSARRERRGRLIGMRVLEMRCKVESMLQSIVFDV